MLEAHMNASPRNEVLKQTKHSGIMQLYRNAVVRLWVPELILPLE